MMATLSDLPVAWRTGPTSAALGEHDSGHIFRRAAAAVSQLYRSGQVSQDIIDIINMNVRLPKRDGRLAGTAYRRAHGRSSFSRTREEV
jgi:hypothetical protein